MEGPGALRQRSVTDSFCIDERRGYLSEILKSRTSPGREKWKLSNGINSTCDMKSEKNSLPALRLQRGIPHGLCLRVHCRPPSAPPTPLPDDQMLWRLTEAPEQQVTESV